MLGCALGRVTSFTSFSKDISFSSAVDSRCFDKQTDSKTRKTKRETKLVITVNEIKIKIEIAIVSYQQRLQRSSACFLESPLRWYALYCTLDRLCADWSLRHVASQRTTSVLDATNCIHVSTLSIFFSSSLIQVGLMLSILFVSKTLKKIAEIYLAKEFIE